MLNLFQHPNWTVLSPNIIINALMLNSIYSFTFIISFVYLFIMVAVFRHRISAYFIMLFVAILLTNFGYMQMSDAETVKMALYANQTIYLGSSFASFFLFMCLADLCKQEISMKIQTLMIIFGSVLFFFASSVGVTDLYYKNVSLIHTHGVAVLVKQYGPLHILYPLYLAITMSGGLFVIIKSFFMRKTVSYKNSTMLLVGMVVTVLAYAFEKIVPDGFPLVPIAYSFSQTVVFILIARISLYDVASISSDVILETSINGVICFDAKGRFLGADKDALIWFPETQELKIDYGIKEENTPFFVQVKKWINGDQSSESVVIEKDDRFIQCDHSIKKENRIKTVHVIFLKDITEQQKYTNYVEQYNANLEAAVEKKTKKIRKIQNDVIIGMASLVEDRDSNTGGHIQRTSAVVNIFVNHLKENKAYKNIPDNVWHNIIKAAPLHDVGKIGIPDNILNKPGKFTDEEYEIMKEHAPKGAINVSKILRNSEDKEFKKIAENVAHFHHEKYNGTGYPEKISKEKIPFEARVMALADVFDALVSKRVYKDSFSYDKAFSIIEESSGSHFDPELCRHFLHCRPQLEELYDSFEN